MKRPRPPAIGIELYRMLAELCDASRLHASAGNCHAAALYIVLEALRVQAEDSRVRAVVRFCHSAR